MVGGRVLLAILLWFGTIGPTLLHGGRRTGIDCCPDGETMQCCRNQSGCSLERCDGSEALPLPILKAVFVLPVRPRLISPDRSRAFADFPARALTPPVLDSPDPPPRA